MQTELEKQKYDEASSYTADKQSSDHFIGELHIGEEYEVNCRHQNGKKYVLKHCCYLTHSWDQK
jgi:hypothetical protein